MWGTPCELQHLLVFMQVSASAEAPALEEYKHSASAKKLYNARTIINTSLKYYTLKEIQLSSLHLLA